VIQLNDFEIGESDTYQEVMRTAYDGSINMLADAVSAIHQGDFDPSEPESLGDLYTAPGWKTAASYFFKNTKKRLE